VAGIVLALSFAALGLVPVRPFRELAFPMSVGLLIDAFVVRTLLVPSLIALFGPVGAWPGRPRAAGPVPAPAVAPPAAAARSERGQLLLRVLAIGIALSVLARLRGGGAAGRLPGGRRGSTHP
jgi:hypothetical protein